MASSTTRPGLRQRPPLSGRHLPLEADAFLERYRGGADAAIAKGYTGITTDGQVVRGLFPIQRSGNSLQPVAEAARAFLAALPLAQQAAASFPLDSDAWQRWSNIHVFVMRHGAALDALGAKERVLALGVLAASLSPRGFETARDVMKLNETIREISGRDEEYGEWLYWLSVMGTPSAEGPWGWQIDGHHLIINCLILGEQAVMTPMFLGSEPVVAERGKYAGTRVFAEEEQQGLELMRSLAPAQRAQAMISDQPPGEVFGTAFRDNLELHYAGVAYADLSSGQQRLLLALAETYIGRMRDDLARAKLDEIKAHLDQTYFAWMGGIEPDSVFYYRLHSPVVLIEFDHQSGIAFDNDTPSRNHIHTVVRTPNGNDYGKDLLRQHYEQVKH